MSQTIPIDKNKTKIINMTFTDGLGNIYDLTGATVYFTIKKKYTQTDAQADIQEVVTTHSDPTSGITQIVLSDIQTDTLSPGNYFFDIQLKNTSDQIFVITKGVVYVSNIVGII